MFKSCLKTFFKYRPFDTIPTGVGTTQGPPSVQSRLALKSLRDLNLVHLNNLIIETLTSFLIYLNKHYLDTLLFSIDEKSKKKILLLFGL